MRWVADFFYLLLGLVYLPVACYHALVTGKNRAGWGERFGGCRRRDGTRQRIWIHAVSLGEINCTPRLIEMLRERLPDCDIVVSTTTDTGYARGVQLYGAEQVFRFPLDFSVVVMRVLRRVQPTLIVLVELEVWYNLVRLATRRGIPIAVVNGRLTERSARRFARLASWVRPMFADLAWVGAQDERIASRFRDLGARCDRVEVTSSLKWDTASVADRVEGADALGEAMGIDGAAPLWVCGSTGPGEEAMILEAYRRLVENDGGVARGMQEVYGADKAVRPMLAIVPRKPERFDEVAELIERRGYTCIRRSRHPDGAGVAGTDREVVLLGDTMGELRKFYSLATVVFVGRSLVPMGGSDPMEVAALGKAIIVGPHMDNFAMPVEALRAADALREADSAEALAGQVAALVRDSATSEALGARAREVVLHHQGATARTADRLESLLARPASDAPVAPVRAAQPGAG